ncbi:hypothetical protein BVY02_00660 [bacterium J17]|nr:hypothetical protein BVY02_00660 [bacterium J17]
MKVIITGASKGIGKGVAEVLASSGFQLGLIARDEQSLKQLQDNLETAAHYRVADLRNHEAASKAMSELLDELQGIDALINNAGLVLRTDIFNISYEQWRAVQETNVNSYFSCTKAVVPLMREQGSGHIINVSSISGRLPLKGGSAYAASKYAVTGFSESLFLEVREHGIKVSTIFPGSVDTESHSSDDNTWKVSPKEVGEACLGLLQTSPTNCISRLEIRPLCPPSKSG